MKLLSPADRLSSSDSGRVYGLEIPASPSIGLERARVIRDGKVVHLSSPQSPTTEQLHAARLLRWHQTPLPPASAPDEPESPEGGVPAAAAHRLLTLEQVRSLVQRAGLLLFAPRPQLAPAPAPSLVEATLGRAEAVPSLADTVHARSLLARLIREGSAVALNLLGAPGTTADNPDFIVSAAAFPFVFTLRGDKLWKQPPGESGTARVSPLAANTYALLAEQGSRTAAQLATDLGKGLTEAAVLRALGELWQQIRVLPLPQGDGADTLWELASARFTKLLKAGANTGQPTALSALATLYLGEVFLATEDEIETFLSPLAPRSRVRDVLHALLAAQELQTLVLEGKQLVHVADALPQFAEELAATAAPVAVEEQLAPAVEGSRIRKFVPDGGPMGRPTRGKPFAAPRRSGDSGERERRPFTQRPARAGGAPGAGFARRPRAEAIDRPAAAPRASEPRESPGRREAAGQARSWQDRSPASRTTGERKPWQGGQASRPGQRPIAPRSRASASPGDRSGAERGSAGWKPAGRRDGAEGKFAAREGVRPGTRERSGFTRAARPEGPPKRNFSPSDRPRREDSDRRPPREGAAEQGKPPFRRFDAPRGPKRTPFPAREGAGPVGKRFGDKPGGPPRPRADRRPPENAGGERRREGYAGARASRAPGDRKGPERSSVGASGARGERPSGFKPRSAKPFGAAPSGGFKRSGFKGAGTGAVRRDRPAAAGEARPRRPGGERPGAGARVSTRPPLDRPKRRGGAERSPGEGPFDKFKGNKKPWGKRPPPRKVPPQEDALS